MCVCVCVCVCVGWVRTTCLDSVCMCVDILGDGVGGVWGEGESDVFSAVIICIMDLYINPVRLFIITSLNAFGAAMMFFYMLFLNE